MATQAQIDANRRNAAKSTGPRTEEGKDRSRMNGVTHGLTASVARSLTQEERINKRFAEWKPTLLPENMFQEYHMMQAVESSVRVEQCQSAGRIRQTELSEIATDPGPDWVNARIAEVAILGKSLKRDPQCVASQLRCTPAGRDWLIAEWKVLLIAVPEKGNARWTNVESNRALDLQGKSKLLRALLLETQSPFVTTDMTRSLILKEIAQLETEQANADHKISKLRASQSSGYSCEDDAKLKLFRRYETSAVRQYDKSMKVFRSFQKLSRERTKPTTTTKPAESPDDKANPIPEPKGAEFVANPAPETEELNPGNRSYRRQQKKVARREAYLARQTC